MNSKKKIILIVSAFVLVVALATVGVLAATSQTMTITNNISFTATNVNASVSITAKNGGTAIADLDSKTTGNQGTLSKTWQAADTSATTSWETPVITFANKTASIVYTITFTNIGSKTATATFTQAHASGTVTGNVKEVYAYSGTGTKGTLSGLNQPYTLTQGQTMIITVTLTIDKPERDVNAQAFTWNGTIATA